MIEGFEKYIKELPEDLQEKARQCRTKEELNEFIAEIGVELPADALEMVSGGCGSDDGIKCPKCGSHNIKCETALSGPIVPAGLRRRCGDCGYAF